MFQSTNQSLNIKNFNQQSLWITMDYHGLPKVYVQLPSAVRDEEPNIIEASRSLQTCWKNIYNG